MDQLNSTKNRISSVAWKLFYEQGYEATTVDQIINECGISKGNFYHYFSAKDDLLNTLSDIFDEEYTKIMGNLNEDMNSFDKLIATSKHLFRFIEESVPVELLSILYSSQIVKKGKKHLLDQQRVYYKVLQQIISEGQSRNQIRNDKSFWELAKIYAIQERAVLYDWCICEGNYPLSSYGIELLEMFLKDIRID
ncbi:TetR/AcrR family transcriptional regulator [Terrisporobacter glycolicus]|uniref:HTH tetR-type domain-containing protein n=1 Tax=Terrisporobacter glycolicus ATCC 14880 = DSM 1288 TaxID=1121315 RepID=A0ABZ2EUB4_9FIRM|nr:TetR/AcrR family transcriptional regulator [Terrisporobacter glycolicus]